MKPLYIKDLIYVRTRKTSYRSYRTASQYLCITDYCSDSLSCSFQKLAKFIVLISFTWLYIMSAPFTGLLLTDNDDIPALTLDEYKQAQAIVILGGGSYPTKELYAETASGAPQLERLRYAAFYKRKRACLF